MIATTGTFWGLFSGIGGAVLILLIQYGPKWIRNWRLRLRGRNASAASVFSDVALLREQMAAHDVALKNVIQFIEGSPDPFLKNEDGTPVVTGGLLEFMARLAPLLKAQQSPSSSGQAALPNHS